jgi:ribosomal protein RSM22 (predicted rRNA methylase)
MNGKGLVSALEDDWRRTLDGVARARGWPSSADVERLGARVAKLSSAYNTEGRARAELLPARLAFSFARDVPKGAGAVRELVASGALAMPEGRALRVLDVGAGLGATTWGVARALERAGGRGVIDATWVDADAEALAVGAAIVAARANEGRAIQVRARTVTRDAARADDRAYDLVLLGQVLSELDTTEAPDARVAKHAALVGDLVSRMLEPAGALVVVEPALRDRTRHLHRVRDAVLAASDAPTLFAPCLHAAPCPALANEGDWCHEDLAVDLPAWLVPIARAAGLRYQGLTFSYLVLRRDGRTLASALPRGGARLRVVSDALVSKGKRELFLCGELGQGESVVHGRARTMRLDRDRAEANRAFDDAQKGDVLAIAPSPDAARPRVSRDATVTPIGIGVD